MFDLKIKALSKTISLKIDYKKGRISPALILPEFFPTINL
jgi:hypothetical protein